MAIFLKNYVLLVLGILALATNVLSTRLTYVGRVENAKIGERQPKFGTVDDNQADAVLRGVPEWSNGAFKAEWSTSAPNLIKVQSTREYPNKNEANTAVQNIQYQVSRNLRQLREQEQQQGGGC